MSAMTDFYEKAKTDSTIKADLEAAKREIGGRPSHEAVYSAVIGVAKKHGVTLSQADFKVQPGVVDDDELRAVSGGCGGNWYCDYYGLWGENPRW